METSALRSFKILKFTVFLLTRAHQVQEIWDPDPIDQSFVGPKSNCTPNTFKKIFLILI